MNHFEFVAWQNMQKICIMQPQCHLGPDRIRKKIRVCTSVDKHCRPLKYLTKIFNKNISLVRNKVGEWIFFGNISEHTVLLKGQLNFENPPGYDIYF